MYIIKLLESMVNWMLEPPLYTAQIYPTKKKKEKRGKKVIEKNEMTQFTSIKSLLETLGVVYSELEYFKSKHLSQKLILAYGVYVSFITDGDCDDEVAVNRFESMAYGFPSIIINMDRADRRRGKDGGEMVNTYFVGVKIDRPTYQPRKKNCVYYSVSVNFGCDKKSKEFVDYHMAAEVEINKETNRVKALQCPSTKIHTITKKSGRKSNRGLSYAEKKHEYPLIACDYLDRCESELSKADFELKKKETIEEHFYVNFNLTMRRELHTNINVSKDNKRCSFSIPENEWKEFFKDRIKVKTKTGGTKPIFHCVSSHLRLVKGKHRPIKTHYRGVREFTWGDYSINIVVPGKHAASKSDLNMTATSSNKNTVSIADNSTVEKINEVIGVK